MKREKIFALILAKAYWTTSIEESRLLINQTAPFEIQAYQDREKQIFPSAQSAPVLQNKSQ